MRLSANDRTILIVAWGNTLRGDDGVGPAVAEEIRRQTSDPRISFQVTHQPVPEMSEAISGVGMVFFIDACVPEERTIPGQIHIRPGKPASPDDASNQAMTHQWGPQTLLLLAQQLFHRVPTAWVCSVTAGSLEPGESLSPPVQAAVPRLVSHIMAVVDTYLKGGNDGFQCAGAERAELPASLSTGEDDRRPP
jgi:hydrogenase maturation protease